MRIIAGERKGMKLYSPKDDSTRPITDRVKESIFSILTNAYNMPAGCKVADIFSGTGSFGLESLSRGAEEVTFVELNREVVEILEKNIDKARFIDSSRVIRTDAFKSAAPVAVGDALYDLAFVDPPFPLTKNTDAGSKLGKMLMIMNEQMRPGGLVLVRTQKRYPLDAAYGKLKVVESRQWGNMLETFLMLENSQYELESDIEQMLEED